MGHPRAADPEETLKFFPVNVGIEVIAVMSLSQPRALGRPVPLVGFNAYSVFICQLITRDKVIRTA